MTRHLEATIETFPIAGVFTISRGSKTQAEVVTCQITEDGVTGRGECVPYRRYGETIEGVIAEIEAMKTPLRQGLDRATLQQEMKPGAARNAIDCALWDLEAKAGGRRVADLIGLPQPMPFDTAYTLSLATPQAMGEQARRNASRPLLKIKLGTEDDESRLRAVRESAPMRTKDGPKPISSFIWRWRPNSAFR